MTLLCLALGTTLRSQTNEAIVHDFHSVNSQANLNFGSLVAGPGGGTLTINSANARTSTGTVAPMLTAPAPAAGYIRIDLNGQTINYNGGNGNWIADYYLFIGTGLWATPSAKVRDPGYSSFPLGPPPNYTLPSITITGPGPAMTVNFTSQAVSTPPGYQTTNIQGTSTDPYTSTPQYIVGTLQVGANQTPGTYTGTVTVPHNDGNDANYTNITVRATVLNALTLAFMRDLDFGTILVNGAGTAVLSNTSALTLSANLVAMASTPQTAQFSAKGTAGKTYVFSLPSSVTVSDGLGNNIVVTGFTFSATPGPLGTFPGTGSQPVVFNVGATLNVPAAPPDGLYQASLAAGGSTFTANIVYN